VLANPIKQFNWVDIFVVIILLRTGYVAIKNGLPLELFKLLGTLLATYLSLHYYTNLAVSLHTFKVIDKVPLELLHFFSFIFLAILGYFIFILLRSLFYRFMKMEAVSALNKWGGLILGIGRGILLAGLLIFILVISHISYLKNSVKDAYSGKHLLKVAAATYTALWNNLASKFMTAEKFNEAILGVQEEL